MTFLAIQFLIPNSDIARPSGQASARLVVIMHLIKRAAYIPIIGLNMRVDHGRFDLSVA